MHHIFFSSTTLVFLASGCLFLIGISMTATKKVLMNLKDNSANILPYYNNRAKNDNIVSFAGLVLLGLFALMITLNLILIQQGVVHYDEGLSRVNVYMSFYYFPSIILPMCYFVMKPKCLIAAFELLS